MRVLDRFAITDGCVGWRYRYANRSPVSRAGWISSGLELSVQLAGTWVHHGRWSGSRRVGPGECFFLSPGESYAHSYQAEHGRPGLQVGLLMLSEQHPMLRDAHGELRWTEGVVGDRRIVDLARYLQSLVETGRLPERSVMDDELARIVARHCTLVPFDGVLLAKRELERNFSAPLYMRHFAEVAGLAEATFTRRFGERFGLSPVRYRLLARVQAGARLLTSAGAPSCAAVARQVGFEDESFFYRTFRAVTGTTPIRYRARLQRDAEDEPRLGSGWCSAEAE